MMRTNESDSCNDRYMRFVLCSMASASAAPNVPEDMYVHGYSRWKHYLQAGFIGTPLRTYIIATAGWSDASRDMGRRQNLRYSSYSLEAPSVSTALSGDEEMAMDDELPSFF